MVGWHHQLNGCEFEQAPGVGNGQGGLACCSPWGCEQQNMIELKDLWESAYEHCMKATETPVGTLLVFHDMLLFSLHSYDLTKYIKGTQ